MTNAFLFEEDFGFLRYEDLFNSYFDVRVDRSQTQLQWLASSLNFSSSGKRVFADIDGGPGNDVLNGTSDADTINGFGGDDTIRAGEGDDTVNGGDGNDRIFLDNGLDTLDGGDGIDTVDGDGINFSESVTFELGTGIVGVSETWANFENYFNGNSVSGAEDINGTDADNVITTGGGSNTINGMGGNDTIRAGEGNDVVNGGDGNDRIFLDNGIDTLDGGDGIDTLDGDGINFADTRLFDLAIVVPDVNGELYTNFENYFNGNAVSGAEDINGTDADNVITTGGGSNTINGLGGNDILSGGAGNDAINGGDGNDRVFIDFGNDVLDGGAGIDTLDGNGLNFADFVGIVLDDRVADASSSGSDLLAGFENYDNSTSVSGGENVTATDGVNIITTGGGNNTIFGLAGNDTLFGGAGSDYIEGGAGADIIDGELGEDSVGYLDSTAGVIVRLFNGTGVGGDAEGDIISNIENIVGSAFNDVLIGSSDNNVLEGNDGDDYLNGLSGSNNIFGGRGNDILDGGTGFDNLVGGDGDDTINGGDSDDFVIGGAGDDILNGGTGDDLLFGGAGIDVIDGGAGDDLIGFGGTEGVTVRLFNQTVSGGDAEGDTISNIENAEGTDANDILIGSSTEGNRLIGRGGDDYLAGLAGDDILFGGAGADILDGGAGLNDEANYSFSQAGVVIHLFDGTGSGGDAEGDTLISIERLMGSFHDDVLIGASGQADTILGFSGDDYLAGLGGDDILTGQDGDDILVGGAGADTLTGGAGFDVADYSGSSAGVTVRLFNQLATGGDAEGDTLSQIEGAIGSAFNDSFIGSSVLGDVFYGGDGNDSLFGRAGTDILVGGAGADILDGGVGLFDVADYSTSNAGVVVRLFAGGVNLGGDAQGDTIVDIESVIGSDFDDTIVGSSTQIDTLNGGDGDDGLFGLAGNDTLIGGAGADVLDGGAGNADTADYSESTAGVTVRLFNGTGVGGDAQGDTLSNIEAVIGSDFNDVLIGANAETNILTGGVGDDYIDGLSGNDVINGGLGDDTLVGGAGNDRFTFAYFDHGSDVITDFEAGNDIIEILFFSFFEVFQTGSNVGIVIDSFGGEDPFILVQNATVSEVNAAIDSTLISLSEPDSNQGLSDKEPQISETDDLPVLDQDVIAEFMADKAVAAPYTYTNDQGILEIVTEDDIGFDG